MAAAPGAVHSGAVEFSYHEPSTASPDGSFHADDGSRARIGLNVEQFKARACLDLERATGGLVAAAAGRSPSPTAGRSPLSRVSAIGATIARASTAAPRRKDSRRSSFERQGQAKSDGSLLGRLSTVGGGRRQSLPGQRGSHVGHNHKLHAAVGLRLDL